MTDDKEHMIHTGVLHPDGSVTDERKISQDAVRKNCPHMIIWPEHWRDDDTCKCDDPTDKLMPEWGYTWNEQKGRWK